MKKVLLCAALVSSGMVAADAKIASIDTTAILMKSKAGKAFEREKEQARDNFQKTLSSKQKEIAEAKETLAKKVQSGAIAEDDFRSQVAQLELKERRAQFDVEEKSTALQNQLKEKELKLRQKVAVTAQEVAKAESWSVVFDKGTLVYAAADVDGTEQLLKACDKKYEAELATSALSKETKKEVKTA